jgi:hypothetical protein
MFVICGSVILFTYRYVLYRWDTSVMFATPILEEVVAGLRHIES